MQPRLDKSLWIVFVVLAAVVALYAGLVYLPQHQALARLSEELDTKRNYVEQTGDVILAIQTVQDELERTNAYNRHWQEHTPGERELANLFGKLSELARAAGTTTTRFDPEPIVVQAHVRRIPVTMGCRGTFEQVHRFLRELEALPQAIWIERLRIEKVPQFGETVDCEVSLVIFADNPGDSGQENSSEQPI